MFGCSTNHDRYLQGEVGIAVFATGLIVDIVEDIASTDRVIIDLVFQDLVHGTDVDDAVSNIETCSDVKQEGTVAHLIAYIESETGASADFRVDIRNIIQIGSLSNLSGEGYIVFHLSTEREAQKDRKQGCENSFHIDILAYSEKLPYLCTHFSECEDTDNSANEQIYSVFCQKIA